MDSDLRAKIKQIVTNYKCIAYKAAIADSKEIYNLALDTMIDDIMDTTYETIKEAWLNE
jgi:hypothetical protein